MNEFAPMAIRLTNAENSFIEAVMDQFGKTELEAEKILQVFKREKVIKLDIVMGQFTLTHGAFWDKQVMDNALDMTAKSNGEIR